MKKLALTLLLICGFNNIGAGIHHFFKETIMRGMFSNMSAKKKIQNVIAVIAFTILEIEMERLFCNKVLVTE